MTGIINSGGNYSNIVLTTQQIFTISLWPAQRVVVYLLSLVVVDVPASPPPRSWTCPRKNPIPRHTYYSDRLRVVECSACVLAYPRFGHIKRMIESSRGRVQPSKNRTIAIASGKGGVGKTVITANLALSLAQQFRGKTGSVVAVDLDLGCGNLNSCLGVRSPKGTINNFLLNKVSDLEQILTPTEQENLQMICSSYSGTPEMSLEEDLKKELLNRLGNLDANYVLVDLGAGTAPEVLDFFLGASEKIVVITPEALSLHNAFVFLKSAILRFLWGELEREEFLSPVKSNLRWMIEDEKDLNIGKLIDRLKAWDRYAAYVLAVLINDLKIKFVVNMYRGGVQNSHLQNFHNLMFKYLCVRNNISNLGFIHFDRGIPESVQAISPFLLRHPNRQAARDFLQVAVRLANDEQPDHIPLLHLPKRPWWRLPSFLR